MLHPAQKHIPLLRNSQTAEGHKTIWRPRQLHDDPTAFISEVKASLPLRPLITMEYLCVSPKGKNKTVGGPIMSVQRSYTMHYRSSTKTAISFTKQPFCALYTGIFFSHTEAADYGEAFRIQGMSFAIEGVSGARECLAADVERAREVGDTMQVHTSLLSLALLSGVNGNSNAAALAAMDIARVMRSAAARHRALRHLCDCIRLILKTVVEWAQAKEPVLKWDGGSDDDNDCETDENGTENEAPSKPKRRCLSAHDLFQTWLRMTNLFFWGWRRDILHYVEADRHSDVTVVKDKVRTWIEEISNTSRMGLRLPMLRWQEHGRTIAEGKGAFLDAAASVSLRLDSLSAWLHCLDLSLAWDAAKVCDKVHSLHLKAKRDGAGRQSGQRSHILGSNQHDEGGEIQGISATTPTARGFLQLQRAWLEEALAAGFKEGEGSGKDRKVKNKLGKGDVSPMKTTVIRYRPAPVAPDSTKAPKNVNVRHAVVDTLQEDVVPEVFAHEMTLMKYVADHGIDKSLQDSIGDLATSVLSPNPFPTLTNSLALRSIMDVISLTMDPKEVIRPHTLTALNKPGNKSPVQKQSIAVFVATGSKKDSCLFGSKPALAGVDVDATLALFGVIPPLEEWVLDGPGGDEVVVEVGIWRSAQIYGYSAHQRVPSELAVMVSCAYGYDVHTDTTPAEQLSHCAVHCALKAYYNSSLLVIALIARTTPNGNSPPADTVAGERFPLQLLLTERQEVEDDLVQLAPEEIELQSLLCHPIPGGEEAMVPFSVRFVFTSDMEEGGGCGETTVATLLYKCVYSSAVAASNVATRHSALVESGLPEQHLQNTHRWVLESVDRTSYLGAYRLLFHLQNLRLAVHDSVESRSQLLIDTNQEEGTNSLNRRNTPSAGFLNSESEMIVARSIVRMLKGPAGRLNHSRRLLGELKGLISGDYFAPETREVLEGRTVGKHAEYSIYFLLDTLAEQPLVRFEGAVESVKLRARLILDHVREITEVGGLEANAAQANATKEAACDLIGCVFSLLEIIQLAIEADTHRCCPEVEGVFQRLRSSAKRMEQIDEVTRVKTRKKSDGRRKVKAA